MKKIRSSKKGFTLAELLIVVAIIGVLVGISIPIFSAQLRKSKVATNQANARAAKAAAVADYLDKAYTEDKVYEYDVANGTITEKAGAATADNAPKDNVADTIKVTIDYTAADATAGTPEKTEVEVDTNVADIYFS